MPKFMYRLMYWLWPRLIAAACIVGAADWAIRAMLG
jgi:hypothetical protein